MLYDKDNAPKIIENKEISVYPKISLIKKAPIESIAKRTSIMKKIRII